MPVDGLGWALLRRSYEASANNLVVADSGNGGITIATGTSSYGSIYFADGTTAADTYRGVVEYNHSNNAMAFWTDATERLRITSAGLVGIGTSAPSSKLDVTVPVNNPSTGSPSAGSFITARGNTATVGYGPSFFLANNSGAKETFWRISAVTASGNNGDLVFNGYNGGADYPERLRITAGGLVGIGTASPSFLLDVASASGSSTVSQFSFTGGNSVYLKLANASNTQGFIGYETQDLTFYNNNTESLRIDSSGRLLVGTSTARSNVNSGAPTTQIETAVDSISTGLSIINNSGIGYTSRLVLGFSKGSSVGSTTVVNNGDTLGYLSWVGADGTNFIESGRIETQIDGTPGANDMPGRLVFSTTADGASSPTERMRIDSSGTHQLYGINDTLFSRTNRGAGTSYVTFAGVHSSTGPGTGTPSCFIYSNGNIQNTNNSYGAISDLKLKENIVDASSQWDDLKALQVRNYNFKEGQTHTQIGLVAQEAELVSPGLVSESPDRDAEGNDLGTVTKSVNYSVLYMKAVKALQEAMERIETLEAKVAALESA
jgi:hypothetical protein